MPAVCVTQFMEPQNKKGIARISRDVGPQKFFRKSFFEKQGRTETNYQLAHLLKSGFIKASHGTGGLLSKIGRFIEAAFLFNSDIIIT